MFKHGDSKGANAGKKIREGIRAKACASDVRTYVVVSQRWDGRWYHSRPTRWHHSRARVGDMWTWGWGWPEADVLVQTSPKGSYRVEHL